MKLIARLPEVELDAIVPNEVPVMPPILDDICLPPYFGPTDHDDLLPLLQIVRSRRPHTVLELGTAHGNTVANICRQCPEATVYTVNALAEQQTGEYITYALTPEQIGRVYHAHGFTHQVVQIFQNTLHLDVARELEGRAVDLAIIDACHDPDYVINDFCKVQPFVSPGGLILLHDTHPSMHKHLQRSYLACMRLRRQGYDIRHLRNTWWAVWTPSAKRGSESPRAVPIQQTERRA
jgi:predicted O-methyltransferase YrrM